MVELLAPAGNLETFRAALDGGADAVYVGAPGFNARNLARDLQLEEIAAMISMCRRLGKKLYVAANSLVLERELEQLVENLAMLERLRPDGLIVQDIGLLSLVRHHFPGLPLHGSTLMTAHNLDCVRTLAALGCERVVLARELTLKEIANISRQRGETELEIFIHGAMCYSYSGLCLFSSYLGGKSGLRGKCVQPCRRAYRAGQTENKPRRNVADTKGKKRTGRGQNAGRTPAGKTSGYKEGGKYLFSMNDLSGLDALPALLEAGVHSLKIEGRLRSSHYVNSVVSAYRLALDGVGDDWDVKREQAQVLLDQAMSRTTSPGYFFTPQPPEAISPLFSGNMGHHAGRFAVVKSAGGELICRFVPKVGLQVGDRLRLHVEPSGERCAFRLKSLFVGGNEAQQAAAGVKVSISLPQEFVDQHQAQATGYDLYKVDGPRTSQDWPEMATMLDEATQRFDTDRRKVLAKIKRQGGILPDLSSTADGSITPPVGSRSVSGMEWWLKVDSIKAMEAGSGLRPDRHLLCYNKQMLSQAARIKNWFGNRSKTVIWALPPLFTDMELGRLRKQVHLLIRSGFRSFQIGHLSQLQLFGDEKVELFADYTVNLMNSQAVNFCAELGLAGGQLAIELDREGINNLLTSCTNPAMGIRNFSYGMMVYGSPALYTARLQPDTPPEKQIRSPRDEQYMVRRQDGYSQTFAERPFSLLPYIDELRAAGLSYGVVELTGGGGNLKRQVEELGQRLMNTGRYGKLSTFNYLGRLE